jgi:hypothetical protein
VPGKFTMDGTTAVGLGLVSWANNKVAVEQSASTTEIEKFREQNMGKPHKEFDLTPRPTEDAAVAFSECGR